jgi:SAM-dependent methyltransferase
MAQNDSTEVLEGVRRAAEQLAAELRAIEAALPLKSEDESFAALVAALDQCLAACSATGLWGQANQLPSSVLWKIGGPLVARGWLMNRARTKPRGYAGDYELLARIYDSRLCEDPLGRLLDRYFQREAAPVAVRNRMAMTAGWIVEVALRRAGKTQGGHAPRSPLSVAIVGSAFGLDIRDALLRLDGSGREELAVTLLDVDPAALDFAREQLAGLFPPQRLVTVSTNLFRLPERPKLAEPLAGSDLIVCQGLFDYLDEASAAAMLRLFWQQLAPGGRLVVFQFAPHNPSRALMEWIGNWYLIYRDERAIASLAAAAGIPAASVQFGAEDQGVDLYLDARRV